MGYQWRYHPAMAAAMEAARKGWLGRVYRFRASIDKPIESDSLLVTESHLDADGTLKLSAGRKRHTLVRAV